MSSTIVADESQGVDDVLASIRKLVSEEAHARSEEALILTTKAEPEDTLMLTPELKVAGEGNTGPLVLDTPSTDQPVAPMVEEQTAPFHDEVYLRSLVGEMIREELQGELGNRITRNVRKLVRQEIDAAMRTQKG